MNQNQTLQQLLNVLLLSALTICSAAFAQNRPVTQYFYDANGNLTSAVDGLNRTTSSDLRHTRSATPHHAAAAGGSATEPGDPARAQWPGRSDQGHRSAQLCPPPTALPD